MNPAVPDVGVNLDVRQNQFNEKRWGGKKGHSSWTLGNPRVRREQFATDKLLVHGWDERDGFCFAVGYGFTTSRVITAA